MMPLRCGRIRYTNDLPIYAAFDEGVIAYPGTLHSDAPAKLNAMLLRAELDLSPISAYAYAKHAAELVLLPDLCIGAPKDVISVVLIARTPPAMLDGATIAVTNESATGANLLRVLLERRYGVRAAYVPSADPLRVARGGEPALLIGDRAIDARLEFPPESVYDLGKLWHDWTGEPIVFAVWAARGDVYAQRPAEVAACMLALAEAYAWGRAHPHLVAARAQRAVPRPPGFYETYYAHLNFTLDAAAQRGLAAYCRELAAIGAIDRVPPTVPEPVGVVR